MLSSYRCVKDSEDDVESTSGDDDEDEYDSDDEVISKKAAALSSNCSPSTILSASPGVTLKKVNKIWQNTLTDQQLSEELQYSTSVTKEKLLVRRNIETYEVIRQKKMSSNGVSGDFRNSVLCKFNGTEVMGDGAVRLEFMKPSVSTVFLQFQGIRALSNEAFARLLTSALRESKCKLFLRIVETVGAETALRMYNQTVDVENVGGLNTADGKRRRTPGGTFLFLLKKELCWTRKQWAAVFGEGPPAKRRKEICESPENKASQAASLQM
ncbi:unnamed protein product [Soboliphyme baturini]|uniref:Phosphorylated adapter RNA export protein n=1 Tax=Soboliphyme baturini TaxID=241478 RepID=A0A183IYE6_9BILA|nr:unnamed protein product [Soboliphyme baturini]